VSEDRDGAKQALPCAYCAAPRCRFVFADAGFAGRLVDWAARILRTTVAVVHKPAGQRGFAVIPWRWVVERTFAWLTAHRRLARDYERHPAHSRSHDPLGRDQHHDPPPRPRPTRYPTPTPPPRTRLITGFSNTL
jgi:transposase